MSERTPELERTRPAPEELNPKKPAHPKRTEGIARTLCEIETRLIPALMPKTGAPYGQKRRSHAR